MPVPVYHSFVLPICLKFALAHPFQGSLFVHNKDPVTELALPLPTPTPPSPPSQLQEATQSSRAARPSKAFEAIDCFDTFEMRPGLEP